MGFVFFGGCFHCSFVLVLAGSAAVCVRYLSSAVGGGPVRALRKSSAGESPIAESPIAESVGRWPIAELPIAELPELIGVRMSWAAAGPSVATRVARSCSAWVMIIVGMHIMRGHDYKTV